MKTYYLLKIKECEKLIKVYDELFHLAMEQGENDLAQAFSEEITYAIKTKLQYIDKLESLN